MAPARRPSACLPTPTGSLLRLGAAGAMLLLLVSCSSNKPAPPHEHKVKYLIAQGMEDSSGVYYGAWYACCECGAELWLTKEQYDWLMAEQQREGGQ